MELPPRFSWTLEIPCLLLGILFHRRPRTWQRLLFNLGVVDFVPPCSRASLMNAFIGDVFEALR